MCKQYTICHECGHKSYRRHSSCNKRKITHISGRSPEPACHGASFLRIYSKGDCNICQIAQAEEDLEFNAEAMRIGLIALPHDSDPADQDEPQTPDEWKMKQMLNIYKLIPPQLKSKPVRTPTKTWQTRRKCKRKNSLLATEVTPETVVGHFTWESIDAASQHAISLDNRYQSMWDATWDVEVPPLMDDDQDVEEDVEEDTEVGMDDEILRDAEAEHVEDYHDSSHCDTDAFSQWQNDKMSNALPISPIQLGN